MSRIIYTKVYDLRQAEVSYADYLACKGNLEEMVKAKGIKLLVKAPTVKTRARARVRVRLNDERSLNAIKHSLRKRIRG